MRDETRNLQELLRVVAATAPAEIDCDEFLARVAAFLEASSTDQPLPNTLQAVSQHLEICPECRDELDALLRVYGRES